MILSQITAALLFPYSSYFSTHSRSLYVVFFCTSEMNEKKKKKNDPNTDILDLSVRLYYTELASQIHE